MFGYGFQNALFEQVRFVVGFLILKGFWIIQSMGTLQFLAHIHVDLRRCYPFSRRTRCLVHCFVYHSEVLGFRAKTLWFNSYLLSFCVWFSQNRII